MSTPNMLLVLPVDHASTDVWGPILATLFTRVDLHDHTTGLGVKVPVSGMNINADLSFSPGGTPRALTDVKAIDFAAVASSTVTSLAGAFFLSDGTGGLTANELYYRTTGGSNVKVTSGAALNVAAFAGGIGGDYAAVGAAVAFDDAADRYTFKQQGNLWARMASGEVRILETGTTEALYVGLAAPAALAASYTITLPLAAPGSTQIVQMDSSGVLTASNTVANAATFSTSLNTPSITGTPNFTGAVTMGSTLGVTGATIAAAITASGLIAANAGLTAGANQHVTVSGTGRHKHGTLTKTFMASSGVQDNSSFGWGHGNLEVRVNAGVGGEWRIPLTMIAGERIVNVRVFLKDSVTGPVIVSTSLTKGNANDTATTLVAGIASAGSGAYQTITMNAVNATASSGDVFVVRSTVTSGGGASWAVLKAEVDYDLP